MCVCCCGEAGHDRIVGVIETGTRQGESKASVSGGYPVESLVGERVSPHIVQEKRGLKSTVLEVCVLSH